MAEPVSGIIVKVDITDEMRKSYLDYAMSVIVGRALPDVRDGLKRVHRRILYSMHEAGITPDKGYVKSARVVGDVMGHYHPHGDAAIYETLVRMAQDFSLRYPLVDGHGNFGSIDGDPPAAMRYTEVKMAPIATWLMADLDKQTVDFMPNFDGTMEEPTVLPARFPNLLVNGSEGIAPAWATNIPPHNLGEVIDGAVLLIDRPEASDEELFSVIEGPDFPTAGFIVGRKGILEAYRKGHGNIIMRGRVQIEPLSGGKHRLVITEIPYQINKARLIERIAELSREKIVDGITLLRDESDRTGMRIVIETRRDVNPNVVLNQLYKHTPLQETFGVNMLVLVNNAPRLVNLREALLLYLDHQKEVVTRRTRFDLEKAEARAHILEGLRIAIDHIHEVVNIIESSATNEEARDRLMARFGLSERQAQAILDMTLRRLVGLEREKIEAEYKELLEKIAYYKALLADERKIMGVVKEELLAIKEKFADPRRTQILPDEDADFAVEDLIPQEDMVVTITHLGYIKRQPVSAYRNQRRGGRGVTGIAPKEEDFVEHLHIMQTHDHILFFTNQGRVYRLRTHEIPEAGRQARGTALINLIPLEPGERVTAAIPVKRFDGRGHLFFATANGTVKKTPLTEYDTNRRGGIIAIGLDPGDELISARLTDGRQEIVLVTALGQAIRFPEAQVRPMGRAAHGVKGIDLEPGDRVVEMDVAQPGADLLVITENGYGKRTPLAEYRTQARGGKGIKTVKLTKKNGPIVGARIVAPDDGLMVVTAAGIIIRTKVQDISQMGRGTQGVRIIRLEKGDRVVALAHMTSREEEDE
ncbi:MAG: DNA gyrase subunit A [Firmicutes bacterium]|nr:DNA gyrase subunit A [Bacillota bacterium]